jgi:hypothetical protein
MRIFSPAPVLPFTRKNISVNFPHIFAGSQFTVRRQKYRTRNAAVPPPWSAGSVRGGVVARHLWL